MVPYLRNITINRSSTSVAAWHSAYPIRQRFQYTYPDTSEVTCLRCVISGELAELAAEFRRTRDLEKRPQPMVAGQGIGEADVISLAAHAQEREVGFLAGQAQANARVGPARQNGVGNAAMVACTRQRAVRRIARALDKQLVEALPRALNPARATTAGERSSRLAPCSLHAPASERYLRPSRPGE